MPKCLVTARQAAPLVFGFYEEPSCAERSLADKYLLSFGGGQCIGGWIASVFRQKASEVQRPHLRLR